MADEEINMHDEMRRAFALLSGKWKLEIMWLLNQRVYRFGELRKALGDREDVRIVGDRFVFQSEVLFGSGSDVIAPGGRDELAKLADALKEIIGRIPTGLPWVLQVDGHTDRVPISTPRFPGSVSRMAASRDPAPPPTSTTVFTPDQS